jgi:hypothetical protein
MQQAHSQCPYLKNDLQFSPALDQKIQGILDHGRKKFTMYRVFPTAPGNSNLNMYTFLHQLEDWVKEKNGKYPSTVYWQVDGGPENSSKVVLAFCEWLVSVTPIEKLVLSRLPVGHTHEDIDARFGTLWKHLRLL